jgi:hypothetical protein
MFAYSYKTDKKINRQKAKYPSQLKPGWAGFKKPTVF